MDEAQKMKKTIHLLRFKAGHSRFNKDFFITQRQDVKRQPALLRQGKSWEREHSRVWDGTQKLRTLTLFIRMETTPPSMTYPTHPHPPYHFLTNAPACYTVISFSLHRETSTTTTYVSLRQTECSVKFFFQNDLKLTKSQLAGTRPTHWPSLQRNWIHQSNTWVTILIMPNCGDYH